MSVRQLYEQLLAENGFQADEAQLRAVAALERCENEWTAYKARRATRSPRPWSSRPSARRLHVRRGGAGKSFLMDCFYRAVPLTRKTRLHFHEFMREVHRSCRSSRAARTRWRNWARIARRYRLICFDEFHVADVTDAMILYRLLESLFAHRVSIVTTSNFHPDGLYPNGLHRDRILPAIELLKANLEVINVDAGIDYRRRTLEQVDSITRPWGRGRGGHGQDLRRSGRGAGRDPVLNIEHRELKARRRAGGVIWFDFQTLCGGPRSQNDYLELASRFHTLLLSGVPQMPPRLAGSRRFTLLVDVLYDRRVKLVSAATPAEQLYTDGPLAHEFPRTVSRLNEMRSAEYLALERRTVDTSLT
jgi:cell division protein ZapE